MKKVSLTPNLLPSENITAFYVQGRTVYLSRMCPALAAEMVVGLIFQCNLVCSITKERGHKRRDGCQLDSVSYPAKKEKMDGTKNASQL